MTSLKSCTSEYAYCLIGDVFADFYTAIKYDIKSKYRTFTMDQKYAAGRALATVNHVARNVETYFSRVKTQTAWNARARAYAMEKNLTNIRDAYYIVQSPASLVNNDLLKVPGISNSVRTNFWRFCEAVQNWEYNRTSDQPRHRATAELNGCEIMEIAKWAKNRADLCKTNAFCRPFLKIAQDLQNSR